MNIIKAERITAMLPLLNERQKRLFLANESLLAGYGGISKISKISGVSRVTITKGIKELTEPAGIEDGQRCRKRGGGRHNIIKKYPGIKNKLEQLLEPYTKGNPMNPLKYSSKSSRNIESELQKAGFEISHTRIADLLKEAGYSLQANRKELAKAESHPDRNEQFEYINKKVRRYCGKGFPVLSIDAKKKESIGKYRNNGREYHKKGAAQLVYDHDFTTKMEKATPYGIYDIFRNAGFVNVGLSGDTAEFAAESIKKWWKLIGSKIYYSADEILITADCGGSNSNRTHLWKIKIQELANKLGKKITVLHFPPGTSKWNKIEHRLFSFISKNWRGKPLISTAVIISLINATKTKNGLTVKCVLDKKIYKTGVKVTDEEYGAINIKPHKFHGEWNYTISPVG